MVYKLNKRAIIISLILILLLLHLFALSIYLQQNRSHIEYWRSQLKHPLFSLILHASQTLPFNEFNAFIQDLSKYNLQINNEKILASIDPTPRWRRISIQNLSEKNLNQLLIFDNGPIKISYQLTNGLWLNYKEAPTENYYDIAMILSILEFLVLGLIIIYVYSLRRFTIPLQDIKQSAERLGIDLNTQPLSEYGPLIVREAANAMNKMQKRIQDLIDSRTQMLAAISHDLRTPITRLKLRADLIEDTEHAKKIIADLDEMDNMIDGILTFAREGTNHEKKIVFDINALLASICDDYSDAGHSIHINLLTQRLPFFGSPLTLKRAFSNLIQNAIKYAGKVWVKLEKIDNTINIYIEDQGPGIPEEELQKVFDPYYRSGSTTNMPNQLGTGLGLTITREIIHSHQGKIKLKNKECSGLCVLINLPIVNL